MAFQIKIINLNQNILITKMSELVMWYKQDKNLFKRIMRVLFTLD